MKTASLALAAGAMVVGGAGAAMADAGAEGAAVGSPGVASGNLVQVPVHVPVNLCGNTINVIGLLNPAAGNFCQNGDNESKGGDWDKGGDYDRGGEYGSHGMGW